MAVFTTLSTGIQVVQEHAFTGSLLAGTRSGEEIYATTEGAHDGKESSGPLRDGRFRVLAAVEQERADWEWNRRHGPVPSGGCVVQFPTEARSSAPSPVKPEAVMAAERQTEWQRAPVVRATVLPFVRVVEPRRSAAVDARAVAYSPADGSPPPRSSSLKKLQRER